MDKDLHEQILQSNYCNEDLAPTDASARTWNCFHLAALWVGMSVCIPTYMLAASLIKLGMTWQQAVATIFLGNAIVLIPMILNAAPGTKYGIPFPVLVRAAFGMKGANVPSVLRALVACGWFGIQTWIGGYAIFKLAVIMFPSWESAANIGFLGINIYQLICFLFFWAINMVIIWIGIESIKVVEAYAAPLLIIISLALFGWVWFKAGSLGVMLRQSKEFSQASVSLSQKNNEVKISLHSVHIDGKPKADKAQIGTGFDQKQAQKNREKSPIIVDANGSHNLVLDQNNKTTMHVSVQFYSGKDKSSVIDKSIVLSKSSTPSSDLSFWMIFFPMLTAMFGFWATLSLNISDFTRYAKNQKHQVLGQLMGLPTTMGLFSFVGVAVTCGALVIFSDILVVEDAPWDPVALLSRFQSPIVVAISMLALTLATLSTNIAANVVSPANSFSNLAPRLINFRTGGIITGLIGIVMMPWKLLSSAGQYIFVWLIGYGALLGPIGGIIIADYYLVRKRNLSMEDLYKEDGCYQYRKGYHVMAMVVLLLSILPNLPGFLVKAGLLSQQYVPTFFVRLYDYTGFIGFILAFVMYTAAAKFKIAEQSI